MQLFTPVANLWKELLIPPITEGSGTGHRRVFALEKVFHKLCCTALLRLGESLFRQFPDSTWSFLKAFLMMKKKDLQEEKTTNYVFIIEYILKKTVYITLARLSRRRVWGKKRKKSTQVTTREARLVQSSVSSLEAANEQNEPTHTRETERGWVALFRNASWWPFVINERQPIKGAVLDQKNWKGIKKRI